ncbi:hypothetical protein BDV93DRAFT_516836 [Ceratobasidium sp. AG-I]|nr:hypothetical protein BDV93DRAFT_516836 [Ceratobasidium sp. AG-I]
MARFEHGDRDGVGDGGLREEATFLEKKQGGRGEGIEKQLGRSSASKVIRPSGIHELLVERERELQTRILHLAFCENAVLGLDLGTTESTTHTLSRPNSSHTKAYPD